MKLKNRSQKMQVINLPHDVVCAENECICETKEFQQVEHNGETGEVGIRHMERLICKSVHLAPGCTSEDLPESAHDVPQVASAIKSRALEVC